MFIAILLVLQINAARPTADEAPATQEASAELTQQQQQLEDSRHRIEQLQAAVAQQKGIVAKFANVESQRIVSRLRLQTQDHTRLIQQKQATMSNIAAVQQAANETARQLADQRQTLEELRKQVQAIEQTLQTEINKRSRTSEFPEGKETQRESYVILLQAGVMYRVHVAPDRTFNSTEVTRLKEATGVFLEPVPGGGLRIDKQGANISEISQRLKGYSKTEHVLRVFFWPDSFAEFQVLRDAMVQESLHYAPEPVPEKMRIVIGGQSSPVFEQ